MPKSAERRVTACLTADEYDSIKQAAALLGISMNGFLARSALVRAHEVINAGKIRRIEVIDSVEADWFLAQFKKPFKPNKKLARALEVHREAIEKKVK